MPFPLSSLLNELLLSIADHLGSEHNISALARTNRRFYLLLISYLYRYNIIKSESSALICAARSGQRRSAARSIAQGGNVEVLWNAFDARLRYRIALRGGRQPVKLTDLLRHNECLSCTPIYAGVLGGHVEVVDLLIQHGANVELALGTWASPLQAAVQSGQTLIVRRLLMVCNVNQPSPSTGRTALHIACLEGQDAIVQQILEAGANPTACDDDLDTPLHLALSRGGRPSIGRLRTV